MAKDPAIKYTDEELKDLEDKIKQVYSEAESDIQKKMDDFNEKFQKKDLIYQKQLKDGLITQEDYDDWKKGQVFTGKQWAAKKNEIAATLHNSNKIATAMINGSTLSVFAENSNYTAYSLEHDAGANFGFDLYNVESVNKLIKEDPQLLPKWKVDQKKDYVWNQKNINMALTQGIIQGESLKDISKRVSSGLAGKNQNLMNTFAKTGMTQAQNSGRLERLEKAKKLGLNVKKEWIATLDNRTRFDHQQLDGQIADTDGYFKVGGLKIRYPGDPEAHPSLVYNCRCALGNHLVDYPSKYQRYDNIAGEPIEGMTYNEWKNAKTKSKSVKPATVKKSTIVDGKDISSTWKRRPDKFDFEIEDVINAQGFDGKPRVVSPEEFERYVEEANDGKGFIAQRTYSAPDQETLDAYRDQLYNGKWYVDCSTGGSQYGQGMYCAADYNGQLTDGIKEEMKHYKTIGESRYPVEYERTKEVASLRDDSAEKAFNKEFEKSISKLTKQEQDVMYRWLGTDDDDIRRSARAYLKTIGDEGEDKLYKLFNDIRDDADKVKHDILNTDLKEWAKSQGIDFGASSYTETLTLDKSAKIINYDDLYNEISKKYDSYDKDTQQRLMDLDEGSWAALLGYDAINAEGHGESGSYTVVLNRTKLIIKGE